MVRGFEGWALPCGCCSALGEQRRKWTSPREVRGRRGQLGAEAMGTEEGQGPLGSCTRGLWSLGWVQSEAGTSRDQPSPEPEAASLPTTQEGTSFLPVLFPWKTVTVKLCGGSGTERHGGSTSLARPWWTCAQCPQELQKRGKGGGGGGRPLDPLPAWILEPGV